MKALNFVAVLWDSNGCNDPEVFMSYCLGIAKVIHWFSVLH